MLEEGTRYSGSVTFVVTTPSFSGPIELLLQLISSHDVDILDVPLAPLVDAFVATLHDDVQQTRYGGTL